MVRLARFVVSDRASALNRDCRLLPVLLVLCFRASVSPSRVCLIFGLQAVLLDSMRLKGPPLVVYCFRVPALAHPRCGASPVRARLAAGGCVGVCV